MSVDLDSPGEMTYKIRENSVRIKLQRQERNRNHKKLFHL